MIKRASKIIFLSYCMHNFYNARTQTIILTDQVMSLFNHPSAGDVQALSMLPSISTIVLRIKNKLVMFSPNYLLTTH